MDKNAADEVCVEVSAKLTTNYEGHEEVVHFSRALALDGACPLGHNVGRVFGTALSAMFEAEAWQDKEDAVLSILLNACEDYEASGDGAKLWNHLRETAQKLKDFRDRE